MPWKISPDELQLSHKRENRPGFRQLLTKSRLAGAANVMMPSDDAACAAHSHHA